MFIIIPAKPFGLSKSRLSPSLSVNQRLQLSLNLFLRTVKSAGQVGQAAVISRNRTVRRLAKQHGAWALVEAEAGLNSAIEQASLWAAGRGAKAVLVLPIDLPLLTRADLTEMIRLGQHSPGIVIAPCHRGRGTKSCLLRPPTLIKPAFGADSFHKHKDAALALDLEPIVYRSQTIAFDLDLPEDLARLKLWPG